jgi:NADH-quinone oxidoreductase subunit A
LNQLRSTAYQPIVKTSETVDSSMQLTPAAKQKFAELSVPAASVERMEEDARAKGVLEINAARHLNNDLDSLSLMALLDIAVFFVVLLVGFAFLWKQGDLNWVRAIARPTALEKAEFSVPPQSGEGR